MKKTILILLLMTSIISCKKETTALANDCLVSISDMKFSKSINNADKEMMSENGHLTICSTAKTDFFNAPDGAKQATAPLLLAEVDNTKPFTFVAKVSPQFIETYDAGALFIYIDNDLWHKFAFEMDERRHTRLVTVRTIGTSDDNNHDIVTQESAYMKISSDTRQVGFYYSTDNVNWNLVRLYKNEYPATIWLGISSQSPMGNGNKTAFGDLSLTGSSIKDFRLGN